MPGALDLMRAYGLTRDDVNRVAEALGRDRMAGVETRVKAALTRAYNKKRRTA